MTVSDQSEADEAIEVELSERSTGRVVDPGAGPYPFEGEDGDEIKELDLEDLDQFADERVTVGELAGTEESWRFGHVVIDEAQDLTPMQWRMVMRRVRGQSMTIVGDLAQRSGDDAVGEWSDHLPNELARRLTRLDLTINYRSPAEIHELSTAVLASFAPEVAPSRAIRATGVSPHRVEVTNVDQMSATTHAQVQRLLGQVDGQIAVIAATDVAIEPVADERVLVLSAAQAKGLEFDAVVVVEPAAIAAATGGMSLLYIAMTRATQRLVLVHHESLPPTLT